MRGFTPFRNKRFLTGFTMIEVVVVTAIIGLLAGFMFLNYRGGRDSLASRQSAQNIAQAVRVSQNRALAGGCSLLPCRFGVHFDMSQKAFKVFEDGGATLNGQYDAGEEVETINLEENISITSIVPSYSCAFSMCADVLFEAPDPATSFMPSGANALTISITQGRSVTVGRGGSVDIN